MILIYTHKITNRVKYTLDLVLSTILGLEFELTADKEVFMVYGGPKLSYSFRPIADELHLTAVDFLFQTGIAEQDLKVFEIDGLPAFFKTKERSLFPFDIFALSFYLVSRYEEYLPHIRDIYDRFDPKASIAVKNKFIKRPIVNIWAKKFKAILLTHFPDLRFATRVYQFIPTLDVDNAYAFRQKGIVRTIGAAARSAFQLQLKKLVQQQKVVFGLERDPYDTFEHLNAVHEQFNVRPIYFFLVADYGLNDKNVPFGSRKFQYLIKSTADVADVGIHPGYISNQNIDKLEKEIKRLSAVLKRDITKK